LGEGLAGEARFIQRIDEQVGQHIYASPAVDQLFAYDNLSGETILRGSVTYERNADLTFEAGAEGAFNFLDARQALTVNGSPIALPSDSVRVEELRGEAFGQGTWRVNPDLTLEGGLRVERSTISQTG